MAKQITYPKELRASAKKSGRALMAIGCDNDSLAAEMTFSMEQKPAKLLFLFCTLIRNGLTPEDAFEQAYKRE